MRTTVCESLLGDFQTPHRIPATGMQRRGAALRGRAGATHRKIARRARLAAAVAGR
jgi:hypothetical protein